MSKQKLGFSGVIAKKFLHTEITPLLALIGLLLGIFAVSVTPREEEPQINVTFANVFIPFPGATAEEVETLIATPAEQVLSEVDGLKHVYSVSRPGMAVITVEFKVGEARTDAIVRLYNKVYSNQDWLPANLGVGQPIIKPKGIDDVPIVSLTLWTDNPEMGAYDLGQVAHAIESELKRVPGTREVTTIGAPEQIVAVELDVQRMASFGIALDDLRRALMVSNTSRDAGKIVTNGQEIPVQAGTFLVSAESVGDLVVGVNQRSPVFLRDVASIRHGPAVPNQYAWHATGSADTGSVKGIFPAVTIAIAKKPGTNAVRIAHQVIERFEALKGIFVPDSVNVTVTRDYGKTAEHKAQTLIGKLIFATSAVVLLVLLTIGWREAIIVGAAVVITLMVTLFASWAWGFTLNRVSLFALIFSIGILVDDAIVVVENIHRHMLQGTKSLSEAIPIAVDEVGGPTILATFTVIAALLPMAFVTGLMGPYMSPIPINASTGMLISLLVALVITPWMTRVILANVDFSKHQGDNHQEGKLYRLFRAILSPFLNGRKGMPSRFLLGLVVLALIAGSVGLAGMKLVVLKMLPFDNKSEFQVIVDMPEGSSVERTAQVLTALGHHVGTVPEVTHYQAYAGTAAPINFNGLVRQYYLREGANVGDLQVNLVDKGERDRKSHEIAASLREPLQTIGLKFNANVKVVEVPPGPPVMSPLVAEIYGLDYHKQVDVAKQVRTLFKNTADIVDIDDTVETPSKRLIIRVDRQKAALLGVSQQSIADALSMALDGEDATYLHDKNVKYPVPIRLEFSAGDKADTQALLSMKLRSQNNQLISLSELISVDTLAREQTIYHKDLLPVVFVTADMAGEIDSPLYGMFDMVDQLKNTSLDDGTHLDQLLLDQPDNPYQNSIKWDGEWQITYDTFRDMGIAYSIGLILIYLLVVAQFRSYIVPLIIMAPIPLTIIGVMPGHAIMGAKFTATSMIGMIALAGIIVRNSILLVDFVNTQATSGMALQEAVIRGAAVRAKPIILTGLAAMLGALFILDDPIFSGLAIALIFGISVSTLLTLIVIPVLYYAYQYRSLE